MSIAALLVSAGVFALVVIGGLGAKSVFVSPEPMDDTRQYWS